MKILVVNSGSSSLKFQVIETSPEQIQANQDRLVARGAIEKIGSGEALVSCGATRFSKSIPDHQAAIETAFAALRDSGAIGNEKEIEGVGHRVVHGGERFTSSVIITPDVVREIENCLDLAPLHNPPNLKGYFASQRLLPHATQVAVFDTAFHHSLPAIAYLYGIPYLHYTRDRIRRYGFHGTSHRYVSWRYAWLHGKTRDDYKLITCHLGNGCSVCAIDHGRSVDTSMGFTPLEGLLMGTRSGDIDAGVVLHLMSKGEMGVHELEVMLNRYSGMYGISGTSNDMRDLLEEGDRGNQRASLAVEIFCYRVRKYIGAYLAAMNGADAILFAGGIGENSPAIRARICGSLDRLGIQIDAERNAAATGVDTVISSLESPVAVWVVPTNEELLIARDTLRCILGMPL